MKIISIANQKGGVGKTVTTLNLAAGMAHNGKRVLVIDFDPQCHLGKYIGHSYDGTLTITDCLFAKATFQDVPTDGLIHQSKFAGIDYIPASLKLSKADMILAQAMFRERVLADVLELLDLEVYDYVLIDCNPSMGVLLTNALMASQGVIIPVQTEDFAVDGLQDMLELIDLLQRQGNPRLQLLGLLPTMMTNTKSSRSILSALHEQYGAITFAHGIRRSVEATNSTRNQTPMVGTKGKLGEQYLAFTEELLSRMEGQGNE